MICASPVAAAGGVSRALAGLAIALGVGAPPAAAEESLRLAPEWPLERPLAAGEGHRYRLDAVAGRPTLVVVEQRGI